jgi:hypothetical protein
VSGEDGSVTTHQPWQRREMPSVLGVVATADRIGRALWVEQQLFRILGAWVTEVSEPAVKERLAVHCHLHAAHVAMWRDRLPQATGVDGASMIVSPGAAIDEALERLSAPDDTTSRLVGMYRVAVPRLVAAHTAHRHATNSVTDATTTMLLDTVVRNLLDEWRVGETMIQTLLVDTHSMGALVAHQSAIEAAVVAAGGILGPDSLRPGLGSTI